MRTNKKLLEIFLNNQYLFENGLCIWVMNLVHRNLITEAEFDYLNKLIDKNPSLMIKLGIRTGYYWDKNNIKPRIKWLKKHLK